MHCRTEHVPLIKRSSGHSRQFRRRVANSSLAMGIKHNEFLLELRVSLPWQSTQLAGRFWHEFRGSFAVPFRRRRQVLDFEKTKVHVWLHAGTTSAMTAVRTLRDVCDCRDSSTTRKIREPNSATRIPHSFDCNPTRSVETIAG
jgi:hypothetical protein